MYVELGFESIGDLFIFFKNALIKKWKRLCYLNGSLYFIEGVQNLKTKQGTFYLRDDDYASILPGQQEDFFQWLRENGNGDLIRPTIHSKTLTSWVKEATEGKELEEDNELTKYINIFTRHRVGVRGGGK